MKKIYYGRAVYDNKEISAVLNVLKNHSLTLIDGPHVKKLEKKNIKNFWEEIWINGKFWIFSKSTCFKRF